MTKTGLAERRRGDGDDVIDFVNSYCRVTKETVAGRVGDLLQVRPWQASLLRALLSRRTDRRRRYRTALIGMPRKNGKSALGSAIALYGLLLEGEGAEVYSCAADRDQARIVFGMARRMIELDPELKAQTRLFRDVIEVPASGSIYRVLSAEAYTKEGLSPNLVIFDELHAQPNDELWQVMNLGSGARIDPLVLGITTAGVMGDARGSPSLCYRLFEHGRRVASGEVDDPSFFFAWWAARDDAAHQQSRVWASANPGYGDLSDPEDFASVVKRTPENEFRTKRLNLWVSSAKAWLPHGSWDRLADPGRSLVERQDVVLALDGSYNNDATALVGCTLDGHAFVVGCWERPPDAPPGWVVPREAVRVAVAGAFERWNVVRMACDPPGWHREIDEWVSTYGEQVVIAWPTNVLKRMAEACSRFYAAVGTKAISHDGSPVLARHLGNCVTKETMFGTVIVKNTQSRKIDAAVALVVAYEQATTMPPAAAETEPMLAWT